MDPMFSVVLESAREIQQAARLALKRDPRSRTYREAAASASSIVHTLLDRPRLLVR